MKRGFRTHTGCPVPEGPLVFPVSYHQVLRKGTLVFRDDFDEMTIGLSAQIRENGETHSIEMDIPTPYVVACGPWAVSKCSSSLSYLSLALMGRGHSPATICQYILSHTFTRLYTFEHESASEKLRRQCHSPHRAYLCVRCQTRLEQDLSPNLY